MAYHTPAYDIIDYLNKNPSTPFNLTITVTNDLESIVKTVYCSVPCANMAEAKKLEGLIKGSDSRNVSNVIFCKTLDESRKIWGVLHD